MTKHAAGIVTILAMLTCSISGCAVVAVTDAVVTVAATAVRVGANVVGATADVARAGVRVLTGTNDQKK
jgi:hypothetical protein